MSDPLQPSQPPEQPQPEYPQPPQRTTHRRSEGIPVYKEAHFWAGVGVGILIGVIVTLLVTQLTHVVSSRIDDARNPLPAAVKTCKPSLDDADTMELGDSNNTLSINLPSSSNMKTYTCITKALKVPQSIQTKMEATSQLSGPQSDSWDGMKITWSYNDTAGLTLTIERK